MLKQILVFVIFAVLNTEFAGFATSQDFMSLANKIKTERGELRAFKCDFAKQTTNLRDGSLAITSGTIVSDKDAEVRFVTFSKFQIQSPMLQLGFPANALDRQDGKNISFYSNSFGKVKSVEGMQPVLYTHSLKQTTEHSDCPIGDPMSAGLAVVGDFDAKFSHDYILANLNQWNAPDMYSTDKYIVCDFGLLKYKFDASRGFWPIEHEFRLDGVLQSSAALDLVEVQELWVPSKLRLLSSRYMEEITFRWTNINKPLEDKYVTIDSFAESTGRTLVVNGLNGTLERVLGNVQR
jgi:hypothetical protein